MHEKVCQKVRLWIHCLGQPSPSHTSEMTLMFQPGAKAGGHWAMPPSGAVCDCSAPSNRECVYRENVPSTKYPSEKFNQ